MKNYLPTRDECHALVQTTDAFFVMEKVIEGQNVEMYNYRLASHSDFFPEDGTNWTELRGLCFVQADNGAWERNILLQKFFNVNQTIDWMYEDVKDKKITRVQNKEDGSIISFVKFENGKVRAKSKMSFESDQAIMAQEVYDNNETIQMIVHRGFKLGFTPIFELVSPDNQIVLEYTETKLVLLQIRNNEDGMYNNPKFLFSEIEYYTIETANNISVPPLYGSELNHLLYLKETSQENIEGWVVTFEDGQMAKIKTDKYLSLHGLIGPDAFRENLLVKTILDGNIDDVIAALVPGVKKDRIISLDEKVTKHFNHLVQEFHYLRAEYFVDYNEIRKDFAIANSKKLNFGAVMKSLNVSKKYDLEAFAEKATKDYIIRKCNGLNDAKKYLEGL